MLALSWGIQASHELPHLTYFISLETFYTATLSGLLCTTKFTLIRIFNKEIKESTEALSK